MTEHIPTFTGKAATYNKAILEILYTRGPQGSSWYIAKEMSKMFGGDTRNIQSVICRKKGRLDALAKHKYIQIDLDTIKITYRGMMAILVAKPEILEKIDPQMYQDFKAVVALAIKNIPDEAVSPFGLKVIGIKKAGENMGLYSKLTSLHGLKKQAEIVEELIYEGINLDLVKQSTLAQLIQIKITEKKL